MKSRLKRKISKIIFVILFVTIFLTIGQLANGKVPSLFGYRVFRVVSQSMMPTISDDTCIIIHSVKENELQVGDIITFISQDPTIYGHYNTHRIDSIEVLEDGTRQYVTKGDANSIPDKQRVSFSQITGRYVSELPFGVWLAKGLKSLTNKKVYFIVIVLPIVICIISYLWQLIGIITGRGEEDDEEEEDEDETLQKDSKQDSQENQDKVETK